MRYLPGILATIFRPPMDEPLDQSDPITRDLGAAITEHERVASTVRDDYSERIRATVDDLLKKLDQTR